MKITFLALGVTFVCSDWFCGVSTVPSVKFAAVIYRHGARTPVDPYPTDPYRDESLWPEKFGQLTNTGKVEHYKLGAWLRHRYRDLLSDKFDPYEICIKSTNVDRTIMSAQINTASLYPPKGDEVWNTKLNWQPVPIHTVADDDALLAMNSLCPAYDKEMENYKNSPEYVEQLNLHADLMRYVGNCSGTNVTDFNKLEYIYSTLNIERESNFTLPEWTRTVFPGPMQQPSCFSFKVTTATHRLARLKAGAMLSEITTHMVKAVRGHRAKKMLVYSGHDTTVANLMGALRVLRAHCPPFTATLLIELLTEDNGESTVRVLYRNSTEIVEPGVVAVPGCGGRERCPLYLFRRLYRNITDVLPSRDCLQLEMKGELTERGGGLSAHVISQCFVVVLAASALCWLAVQCRGTACAGAGAARCPTH